MTLVLPRPRRFSTLLSIHLLALCLAATAVAQAAPKTHLQLMLPFISGSGYQGNDAVPSDLRAAGVNDDSAIDHRQLGLLGLSLGRDYAEHLRAEIYGSVLFAGGLRGLVGVRGGPQWSLLAPTSTTSKNVDLRFLGLVGISYRGQRYNIQPGFEGQRAIALTLVPAMEYTYFSSPSLGWSIGLKTELSYVIDQMGSPFCPDVDEGDGTWDGYRWGLTGGLDLGLVF
jgi:hypothetical protein